MLPRAHDPGYFVGDDDASDTDPLPLAMNCKQAYQTIRAVPAEAGSAVVFTHRVIHWGSRGRKVCGGGKGCVRAVWEGGGGKGRGAACGMEIHFECRRELMSKPAVVSSHNM